VGVAVELLQFGAKPAGLSPDDGFDFGIVACGPVENFSSYDRFFESIAIAGQSAFNHVSQETASPFGRDKFPACEKTIQFRQSLLIRFLIRHSGPLS
jgi:hypothetical protein